MPNLAATLKDEIRRLARKEIRLQIRPTRRAATRYRAEIAQLKRLLKSHERKIAAMESQAAQGPAEAQAEEDPAAGSRFSARSVRAQRRRLKLSAGEFAKLLGVSAQTVYHWELGKSRPRRSQFAALVAARRMGRRDAAQRLEEKPKAKGKAKRGRRAGKRPVRRRKARR